MLHQFFTQCDCVTDGMEITWHTVWFKNVSYSNLSYTFSFFLFIVPVSVTQAICPWLKKRWIECWKVMISDWGQISEVNFIVLSPLRLVSLHGSTGFNLQLKLANRLGLQVQKMKGADSYRASPVPETIYVKTTQSDEKTQEWCGDRTAHTSSVI